MTVSPGGEWWWRPEWWGPPPVYQTGPPNVILTDEQASWIAAAIAIAGAGSPGTAAQLGKRVREAAKAIRGD